MLDVAAGPKGSAASVLQGHERSAGRPAEPSHFRLTTSEIRGPTVATGRDRFGHVTSWLASSLTHRARFASGGWILLAILVLLLLLFPPAASAKIEKQTPDSPKEDVEAIGERDVDGGVNFYSLEKEIALGKMLAQEVERSSKIVDDPAIAEYVNRIGQNLVRNSDARVPFTIKVIDSEEVNAFALPGGFFFVHTGVVLLADSEAELASVMAHEIAHVAARHGTRQATRAQIVNLASIPLIFLGGWTGYGIRQAAGFAIPVTFLKFSRGFEEEADFLGVQYLYATGYDPNAMVEFFERLQAREKRKPGTMSKLFSSHPATSDRAKRIQQRIGELLPNRPEYVINTSEFEQVKDQIAQLHMGREGEQEPDRPTLRRKPGDDGTIPVEEPRGTTEEEEDERPTLKRR
jgi:predicted Zn-dependent protease